MDVVRFLLLPVLLTACAANQPPAPGAGRHLAPPAPIAAPAITEPEPPPEPEPGKRYTVVVHDVPARDLLFNLARETGLNVDVDPGIEGSITLDAVDQTLPQILARVARQVDIRWELDGLRLTVTPDTPFLRSYRIDYVNMSRQSSGTVAVSTSIATTGTVGTNDSGGSGNDSSTVLSQESNNRFWETLVANVGALLAGPEPDRSADVIASRESGVLTVRASGREHDEVKRYLDQVLTRARQQVLIEATIVEVELSDEYQAGIDWTWIDGSREYRLETIGGNLNAAPVFTADLGRGDDLSGTIKLLERFGDLRVLSSPKLMVLNNQTAMLKVVDNRVYFTIGVDITTASETGVRTIAYESMPHTVPIGLVMAVTPQIGSSEQVILNVRPTISRILGFVQDPNPALAEAKIVSNIPEIQVREIESILRVQSGEIAVLGGLMQDSVRESTAGVPGLARLPVLGQLFSFRNDETTKTELVIFLRPVVVNRPGLEGDLRGYRDLLPAMPPILRPRLGGV